MNCIECHNRGLGGAAWMAASLLTLLLLGSRTSAGEELPAVDPTVELTLPELEQMALSASPRLQQAAAAIGLARGERISATAYPNPELSYDGSGIGGGGGPGAHGFFIDQEIVLGPKQSLTGAAGQFATQRRQLQFYAEQLRVLNDIRQRYYELLALQSQLGLEQHLIQESERLLNKAQELQANDSDEIEEPELLLARGALRRRRLHMQEVPSRLRAAWEQLAAVTGLSLGNRVSLAGTLQDGMAGDFDSGDAMSELLHEHPELQAARAAVGGRRAELGLARANLTPNVIMRAGVDYDFNADETLGLVRLSVPLQINSQGPGAIMEAEARLRDAVMEVERVEADLRNRLAEALDRRRRYQATVAEYSQEILPEARKAYEMFFTRFESEESSFSRASTAQENYFDAQIEYLQALLELRHVEVDLSTRLMRARLSRTTVDLE